MRRVRLVTLLCLFVLLSLSFQTFWMKENGFLSHQKGAAEAFHSFSRKGARIFAAWGLGTRDKKNKTEQDSAAQSWVNQTSEHKQKVLFEKHKLVIYSSDFHISPIHDLKDLLQPLGVKFIDQSLSAHCDLTKTCQKGLKVITFKNGIGLDPKLIPEFYKTYKDDPQMESVDAFVCFHPSSLCELFMPFNKSLIVIASTRYEMGRTPAYRWTSWNRNLKKISQDPRNIVAGNNLYDAKYIQYFTGINAQVLESFCGYIEDKYVGNRPGFLLAPVRTKGFQAVFFKNYTRTCQEHEKCPSIKPVRLLYHKYKYSDLAAHQGIVHIPYQVSYMSIFEQYRMNIPLFFPSKELLADWQFHHQVMKERTWDGVHNRKPAKSSIPPDPRFASVPDPNNERNMTAIKYWIQFSDFYQFPHITYFDSEADLLHKLNTVDLKSISSKMKAHNIKLRKQLISNWSVILTNVAKYSRHFEHELESLNDKLNSASVSGPNRTGLISLRKGNVLLMFYLYFWFVLSCCCCCCCCRKTNWVKSVKEHLIH